MSRDNYLRDALSKAGYTPVVTGDPEEEERPDLVLLDLMLPGTQLKKMEFTYPGAVGRLEVLFAD